MRKKESLKVNRIIYPKSNSKDYASMMGVFADRLLGNTEPARQIIVEVCPLDDDGIPIYYWESEIMVDVDHFIEWMVSNKHISKDYKMCIEVPIAVDDYQTQVLDIDFMLDDILLAHSYLSPFLTEYIKSREEYDQYTFIVNNQSKINTLRPVL